VFGSFAGATMLATVAMATTSSLLPSALQPPVPADSPFTPHWKLAPRQYVARRLAADAPPLTIDGDLEKPEWAEVEWSVPFGDIRGVADAPKEAQPTEKQRTRMKMRWDDEYLYVAAHLESDRTVRATFTKHNEPIFTEDSDLRSSSTRPAPRTPTRSSRSTRSTRCGT